MVLFGLIITPAARPQLKLEKTQEAGGRGAAADPAACRARGGGGERHRELGARLAPT
jgi:hypothetical protein